MKSPPIITLGDYVTDPADVGDRFKGDSVVCIGTFDGVHRGHQGILARAVAIARERCLTLVVLTFHPHPKSVVTPETAPQVLTTPDSKATLLREYGANYVVMMPFTRELAATSATEFIESVIRGQLRAKAIVFGYDFRFGCGREGTPEFLEEWGDANDCQVEMVEAVTDDLTGGRISSSLIRKTIESGKFNEAIRLLGHAMPVSGRILKGAGRGKGLGYPTWNLHLSSVTLPPPVGIYASWAGRSTPRPAMAYYGSNPTFGDGTPRLEAYLFDVTDDAVPAEEETIWLSGYVRDEVVFDGADALKRQLADDERVVRDMLLTRTTGHTKL